MKCPTCDIDLTIAERQGVEIDICPRCRGVWLDRGELDKIIDRYSAMDDDDFDRSHRDERWRMEHGRRRKSFWSELFD